MRSGIFASRGRIFALPWKVCRISWLGEPDAGCSQRVACGRPPPVEVPQDLFHVADQEPATGSAYQLKRVLTR